MLAKAKSLKNPEPLGVKTQAKPRHTTYQSSVTGLYENYGGLYPPFLPSRQGANMRHIRKPEPRNIEV